MEAAGSVDMQDELEGVEEVDNVDAKESLQDADINDYNAEELF